MQNFNFLGSVEVEYQPSGARGTRSPPATLHRLQRRRGQLTFPKSKNGGHFTIVTWALQSTFAKLVFPFEGEDKLKVARIKKLV